MCVAFLQLGDQTPQTPVPPHHERRPLARLLTGGASPDGLDHTDGDTFCWS